MKVKVNFKTPTVLMKREKYEEMKHDLEAAYSDIEQMFQENKDLRISEGHLRDEVKFLRDRCAILETTITAWQQEHEAQRQQLVAKDNKIMNLQASCDTFNKVNKELNYKLSQEEDVNEDLRDQLESAMNTIEAQDRTICSLENELNEIHEAAVDSDSNDSELHEQLDHYKKAASLWREKAEAIQEYREDAEARLLDMSNRFIKLYEENAEKEREAREVIVDLRDELNDRIARTNELEQRCNWLNEENAALVDSNNGFVDIINEHLCRIKALEAEAETLRGDIAGEREDYAELERELYRMTALASEYYEKWSAMAQRNSYADNFARAIITAVEKASANDTAFSPEDIHET